MRAPFDIRDVNRDGAVTARLRLRGPLLRLRLRRLPVRRRARRGRRRPDQLRRGARPHAAGLLGGLLRGRGGLLHPVRGHRPGEGRLRRRRRARRRRRQRPRRRAEHDGAQPARRLGQLHRRTRRGRVASTTATTARTASPTRRSTPRSRNHPNDYGKVQPFDPCDPAPWSRTLRPASRASAPPPTRTGGPCSNGSPAARAGPEARHQAGFVALELATRRWPPSRLALAGDPGLWVVGQRGDRVRQPA